MSAPKAKNTDGKLIKKQKARIKELVEENGQLRMSVLNIRQMYEGMVGEKVMLRNQLQRANQILVAATVQARGKTITVKEKVLAGLEKYAGVDTKEVDGDLIITALTKADMEKMLEELDDSDEA